MSYDLFLKPNSTAFDTKQFTLYFSKRPCYTVSNGEAFYENEDTGVYFSFHYDAELVAFNLNYYRPHFFGLEAASEVAAFVSAFNFSIEDPQTDGMEDGPFSIEGFLRGWNAGNHFAYRAILSQDERPETHVYPSAELERIWRWNFNRSKLQSAVGDYLFVPKIMFMKGENTARTAVVWPDACPIYLPKADLVFVLRDELTTTPNVEDHRETTVVEWADIEPVVSEFPYDEEHGHFRLEYEIAPYALSHFVQSLPIVQPDREMGLANDSVLNAELVTESLKGTL